MTSFRPIPASLPVEATPSETSVTAVHSGAKHPKASPFIVGLNKLIITRQSSAILKGTKSSYLVLFTWSQTMIDKKLMGLILHKLRV